MHVFVAIILVNGRLWWMPQQLGWQGGRFSAGVSWLVGCWGPREFNVQCSLGELQILLTLLTLGK